MRYKNIAVVKPGLIETILHLVMQASFAIGDVTPSSLLDLVAPLPFAPVLRTLIGFAIIITCNSAVLNVFVFPNLTHPDLSSPPVHQGRH
jgi:hypothetical protein